MKKDEKFLKDLESKFIDLKPSQKNKIMKRYIKFIEDGKKNKRKMTSILKDLGKPDEIAKKELEKLKTNKLKLLTESLNEKVNNLKEKINNIKEKSNKKKKLKETKYITKSPLHTSPVCPYADKCGGCTYQIMSYEEELSQKQKVVEEILGKKSQIIKCDDYNYRNKITLKVKDGKIRRLIYD